MRCEWKDSAKGAMVDRQTFDRLMLEHLAGAQRFTIRLCGNLDAAEEIMQEALVRASGAWRSFRGQSTFRTWLFQIIVNVFRDRLRARKGPASLDETNEPADGRTIEPGLMLQARELAETVAACVSSLPARQRELLVLVAFEQFTTQQAAVVLGITDGNARTTLHLARAAMKRQLARYLNEERREA